MIRPTPPRRISPLDGEPPLKRQQTELRRMLSGMDLNHAPRDLKTLSEGKEPSEPDVDVVIRWLAFKNDPGLFVEVMKLDSMRPSTKQHHQAITDWLMSRRDSALFVS